MTPTCNYRILIIMPTTAYFTKISVLVPALIFSLLLHDLMAGEIRAPVFAGRFYPSERAVLNQTIAKLVANAEQTKIKGPAQLALRALIIPHAGYIYSGVTAAHCTRILKGRRFSRVVVMGPDHRVGIRVAAISNVSTYQTPLGKIDLHGDCKTLRNNSPLFEYSPASDRSEHSIEVVLPFLQYSLGDFKMIPVVIGGGDPRTVSAALETVIDDDTLLVASSDLSHYLSYNRAVSWDRATLSLIIGLRPEELMNRRNSACGKAPVAVILHLARQRGWKPVLLNYTNSGDTAGDKQRVVGYAAVAFYGLFNAKGGSRMERCFDKKNGKVLLDHARRTIMERLGEDYNRKASELLEQKLAESCFENKRGTFVTLTLDGRLRGCIGNMSSTVTLRDGVRQNAVNAAFQDPRFSPLTGAELEKVHIEISILTEPEKLEHKGGDDLVQKLRPNIDGVVISKGAYRATFLPQVWEQLPRPDDFLSRLCTKAGIPANAWRSEVLEVQTYQVISIEEEH